MAAVHLSGFHDSRLQALARRRQVTWTESCISAVILK
jgi:hypothetical protein